MNSELLERELALAALALVGILAGLTFNAAGGEAVLPSPTTTSSTEQWREATVGVLAADQNGQATSCGVTVDATLQGIAHPVLPCGARITVEANGVSVDTAVIGREGYGEGQEFALTQALAAALGIQEQATVRWRFSGGAR